MECRYSLDIEENHIIINVKFDQIPICGLRMPKGIMNSLIKEYMTHEDKKIESGE